MEIDFASKIKPIVEDFLSKTLGNEKPNDMCLIVSFALCIYLNSLNEDFNWSITYGFANVLSKNEPLTTHYLLCLGDDLNSTLIIDATIHQFYPFSDSFFVGTLLEYRNIYKEQDSFEFMKSTEAINTCNFQNCKEKIYSLFQTNGEPKILHSELLNKRIKYLNFLIKVSDFFNSKMANQFINKDNFNSSIQFYFSDTLRFMFNNSKFKNQDSIYNEEFDSLLEKLKTFSE